jgi:hypothetical protein
MDASGSHRIHAFQLHATSGQSFQAIENIVSGHYADPRPRTVQCLRRCIAAGVRIHAARVRYNFDPAGRDVYRSAPDHLNEIPRVARARIARSLLL